MSKKRSNVSTIFNTQDVRIVIVLALIVLSAVTFYGLPQKKDNHVPECLLF